jgi:hypothetical protein
MSGSFSTAIILTPTAARGRLPSPPPLHPQPSPHPWRGGGGRNPSPTPPALLQTACQGFTLAPRPAANSSRLSIPNQSTRWFGLNMKEQKLNFLIGYELAQRDDPPEWNPRNFFGTNLGSDTTILRTDDLGRIHPMSQIEPKRARYLAIDRLFPNKYALSLYMFFHSLHRTPGY